MTIRTAKYPAVPWIVLSLCCGMTQPLPAQVRGAGGGAGLGGGGGGASRSAASSSASTTPDRPANGEVGSANFYVDPDSHRVFVTADERTAGYVTQVMSTLDRPKPQVLIKVVFLQVTYNNGYDVGIEGGITKNVKTTTSLSASNLFGLVRQGTRSEE